MKQLLITTLCTFLCFPALTAEKTTSQLDSPARPQGNASVCASNFLNTAGILNKIGPTDLDSYVQTYIIPYFEQKYQKEFASYQDQWRKFLAKFFTRLIRQEIISGDGVRTLDEFKKKYQDITIKDLVYRARNLGIDREYFFTSEGVLNPIVVTYFENELQDSELLRLLAKINLSDDLFYLLNQALPGNTLLTFAQHPNNAQDIVALLTNAKSSLTTLITTGAFNEVAISSINKDIATYIDPLLDLLTTDLAGADPATRELIQEICQKFGQLWIIKRLDVAQVIGEDLKRPIIISDYLNLAAAAQASQNPDEAFKQDFPLVQPITQIPDATNPTLTKKVINYNISAQRSADLGNWAAFSPKENPTLPPDIYPPNFIKVEEVADEDEPSDTYKLVTLRPADEDIYRAWQDEERKKIDRTLSKYMLKIARRAGFINDPNKPADILNDLLVVVDTQDLNNPTSKITIDSHQEVIPLQESFIEVLLSFEKQHPGFFKKFSQRVHHVRIEYLDANKSSPNIFHQFERNPLIHALFAQSIQQDLNRKGAEPIIRLAKSDKNRIPQLRFNSGTLLSIMNSHLPFITRSDSYQVPTDSKYAASWSVAAKSAIIAFYDLESATLCFFQLTKDQALTTDFFDAKDVRQAYQRFFAYHLAQLSIMSEMNISNGNVVHFSGLTDKDLEYNFFRINIPFLDDIAKTAQEIHEQKKQLENNKQ
ncbi:MAG: hypothetical protein J6Y94_00120 [Bacteriovoracaceae bacterium]|nr:hypothetical protein [Bacteriovoracaceae bacterium]